MLISYGLMRKGDYEIFVNAKQELLGRLAEFWQPDIIFNLIMNDVFPRLSHEDKLILALSIIFRRKPKAERKCVVGIVSCCRVGKVNQYRKSRHV